MSSRMNTPTTEQELGRNRQGDESELSAIRHLSISDSPAKEEALSPSPSLITPEMVASLYSASTKLQWEATEAIRKLLSHPSKPPIAEVIARGLVPRFVHFLEDSRFPVLQVEAAWILTNLATGTSEQTQAVVEAGAVPRLVHLLATSPNGDVVKQAVWALGNIAGDSPTSRDVVLNCNVLPPLIGLFSDPLSTSELRNATWTLSNLCRGKEPPPDWATISASLPLLSRLINNSDTEVVASALWSLSHLSDGPTHQIQAVIDSGICRRAVQLLSSHRSSAEVLRAALCLVGTIVGGTDAQVDAILTANPLPALARLLLSPNVSTLESTALTLANITAGNGSHIQAVLDAHLVRPLMGLLSHGEVKVRTEATWALRNATFRKCEAQIETLVECGLLPSLSHLLTDEEDTGIITVALEALENILLVGAQVSLRHLDTPAGNVYATAFKECDGLAKLASLSSHAKVEIAEKVSTLREKYFATEVDVL